MEIENSLCIVKVKVTLQEKIKAQSGSKGTALLYHLPRHQILVGGQRQAPATLTFGKRPAIHRTEGCVIYRAGLERCGKYRPYRDSIPGPSSLLRFAIPTELSGPIYVG